jgi:hypothetical protein
VRAKALLLAQSETTLSAIQTAVDQGIEKLFRGENGFRVPVPALWEVAAKPESKALCVSASGKCERELVAHRDDLGIDRED